MNRRLLKNLFIDPKLQFKYLLFNALPVAFIASGFSWLSYRYFAENYQMFIQFMDFSDAAKTILRDEWRELTLITIGSTLLTILIASVFMLVIMHRLIGPIFKIRKFFRTFHQTDAISRFKFRDRDEFKDLEPLINQFLDQVRGDFKSLYQELKTADASTNEKIKQKYQKYLGDDHA